MRYCLIPLAFPMILAGCATMPQDPWSEVTGERYHVAIADRGPVNVVSIGGRSAWASGRPTMVEPGTHRIVVESLPHGGFRGGRTQAFELALEPCKRYHVNAQFESAISASYKPVVDAVIPIPGCPAGKG